MKYFLVSVYISFWGGSLIYSPTLWTPSNLTLHSRHFKYIISFNSDNNFGKVWSLVHSLTANQWWNRNWNEDLSGSKAPVSFHYTLLLPNIHDLKKKNFIIVCKEQAYSPTIISALAFNFFISQRLWSNFSIYSTFYALICILGLDGPSPLFFPQNIWIILKNQTVIWD